MAKNAKPHDELITLLAELEDARLAIDAARAVSPAALTEAGLRFAAAARAWRKYRLETDFDDVPDAPAVTRTNLYELLGRRRD